MRKEIIKLHLEESETTYLDYKKTSIEKWVYRDIFCYVGCTSGNYSLSGLDLRCSENQLTDSVMRTIDFVYDTFSLHFDAFSLLKKELETLCVVYWAKNSLGITFGNGLVIQPSIWSDEIEFGIDMNDKFFSLCNLFSLLVAYIQKRDFDYDSLISRMEAILTRYKVMNCMLPIQNLCRSSMLFAGSTAIFDLASAYTSRQLKGIGIFDKTGNLIDISKSKSTISY